MSTRQYSQFPLRIPGWLALGILIAIHLVAIPFALRLHFNNVPDIYSPKDAPAILLRQDLLKEFPNDEVAIALFEGKNLYSPDFLAALHRVAGRMEKHANVDRVLSLTTIEHIQATGEGFEVQPLVDPDALDDHTPAEWREKVLSDPLAPGLLASEDGQAIALAVRPVRLDESMPRLEIQYALIDAIKTEKLDGQFTALAGTIVQTVGELESIWRDSIIFIPLTMLLGLGLLWWVVGRVRPVLVGAAAMSSVVITSVAGLAASGQPYTPISAMIPTLMSAYTTATLLHLYAAIQRGRIAQLPRYQRISRALHETFKPGLFNVLTTGAGMASLALAPVPPAQVFGLAGALGVAMVFIVVYLLVPAILLRWDIPRWPRKSSGMGIARHIAAKTAVFSIRHAKAVLITSVLLILVTIPLAMKVTVESDLIKFFGPGHPVSTGTQKVEAKLSGVTAMEVVLTGSGRDSLKDPEVLSHIESLQNWIDSQPEIDQTFSLVDAVRQMNRAFNGGDSSFDVLPKDRKLINQYLLIYDGDDLYENVNREFDRGRITMNLNIHGSSEIRQVMERINVHIQENPIPNIKTDFSGFGRLFVDQERQIVQGQINSFAGAFIQILLLMALLWRSISASLVCLIPNLAPLFFIFVIMGTTGIHLDVATALIAGVVLGITVDDTIHLYHGYLKRRQKGASPAFAIARSFESSGRAVIAISLILVSQFMLLTFSNFEPTVHFGLLCAIGLLAGQIFELLLMPALMIWWSNHHVPPAHGNPSTRTLGMLARTSLQRSVRTAR